MYTVFSSAGQSVRGTGIDGETGREGAGRERTERKTSAFDRYDRSIEPD